MNLAFKKAYGCIPIVLYWLFAIQVSHLQVRGHYEPRWACGSDINKTVYVGYGQS